MKPRSTFVKVLLSSLALTVGAIGLTAGDDDATEAPTAAVTPIFTEAQAEAGASVYQQSCVACHFSELEGDNFAAPLAGRSFLNYWSGRTIEQFHTYTKTQMPLGNAGSLSDEAYSQVIAFILAYNGFPAGATELPDDATELADVTFGIPDEE